MCVKCRFIKTPHAEIKLSLLYNEEVDIRIMFIFPSFRIGMYAR